MNEQDKTEQRRMSAVVYSSINNGLHVVYSAINNSNQWSLCFPTSHEALECWSPILILERYISCVRIQINKNLHCLLQKLHQNPHSGLLSNKQHQHLVCFINKKRQAVSKEVLGRFTSISTWCKKHSRISWVRSLLECVVATTIIGWLWRSFFKFITLDRKLLATLESGRKKKQQISVTYVIVAGQRINSAVSAEQLHQ